MHVVISDYFAYIRMSEVCQDAALTFINLKQRFLKRIPQNIVNVSAGNCAIYPRNRLLSVPEELRV